MREDADHAAGLLGFACVDGRDATLGHRAEHNEAIGGIRDLELGGVLRLAGDLGESVDPGGFFA
jgi:hypothetical protein